MTNRYFHRARTHIGSSRIIYVLVWPSLSLCIALSMGRVHRRPSFYYNNPSKRRRCSFFVHLFFHSFLLCCRSGLQLPDLAHSPSSTSSSGNDYREKRTARSTTAGHSIHSTGNTTADQKTSLFCIIFWTRVSMNSVGESARETADANSIEKKTRIKLLET